jgi:hypothetical protein
VFELPDCASGKRGIAVKVVSVKDRADIVQAMSGDGRDRRLGAFGERQPRHRGPAQIIERDAHDASLSARLAPRCAEAVGSP